MQTLVRATSLLSRVSSGTIGDVAVKEQEQAEVDLRRGIARHRALRMFATGGVVGGAFAFCLVLAAAPGASWKPGILLALMAALAVWERRKLGRLRAEAMLAEGDAGPPKTRAEELAEAVEALRQRQWDAIANRAYLAAGGTAERPGRTEARAVAVTPPKTVAAKPAVTRPDSGAVELDPRWEWKVVRGIGVPDRWVKARCRHLEVEPVQSLAGEVVAQLCLTCDTQFPAPREP